MALKQTKEMDALNPLIKTITDNPDLAATLIELTAKQKAEKLADEIVAKKIKAQKQQKGLRVVFFSEYNIHR